MANLKDKLNRANAAANNVSANDEAIEEVATKKAAPAAKKEKAPATPKKEKVFTFSDECSYDERLDVIEAALAAEDADLPMFVAADIYFGKKALDSLLIGSYVCNGGELDLEKLEKAVAKNREDNAIARPKKFDAAKALELWGTGSYKAADILSLIPETEDEVYFFLLFVENGWNQMSSIKGLKGKNREAAKKLIMEYQPYSAAKTKDGE